MKKLEPRPPPLSASLLPPNRQRRLPEVMTSMRRRLAASPLSMIAVPAAPLLPDVKPPIACNPPVTVTGPPEGLRERVVAATQVMPTVRLTPEPPVVLRVPAGADPAGPEGCTTVVRAVTAPFAGLTPVTM